MALSFDDIVKKLSDFEVESPRLEARMMIAAAKNIDCDEVSALCEISFNEAEKIQKMIEQRSAHCPLDKILGHREFYKYDFLCNTDVLSPRPDTEVLVEQAAKLIFKHEMKNILELGVGSGCILLSLLADFPYLSGVGIDISQKALDMAQKNAQRLGVEKRVQLFRADWNEQAFAAKFNNRKFEIIVSNPPYIPSSEILKLSPEVKNFDPLLALDGGESGFNAYERIAELAPTLLNNDGYLLFEAGINQAEKIALICEKNGLKIIDIVKDLSGIERCVIVQKTLAK